MTETTDLREKAFELLESFSTAMFVTVRGGGVLASRPMHVAATEKDKGEVWFFAGRGGSLAEEVAEEQRVLLAFQNDSSAFLSVRGKARLVEDRAKIKQLWKEAYKVWFPGGAEDPEIALVAVDAIDAEYWDTRGANKVKYLFEAAKAYVKGEKPEINDAGQHGKTRV